MNQEVSAQEIIDILAAKIAQLEVDKAILSVQVTGLMKSNLELSEGAESVE